MYAIIAANCLGACAAPALQAMISQTVAPGKQGVTMGALSALNSMMMVLATLVGTTIFAQVTHLPRSDWRVGATFFFGVALLLTALLLALRHFSRARLTPSPAATDGASTPLTH